MKKRTAIIIAAAAVLALCTVVGIICFRAGREQACSETPAPDAGENVQTDEEEALPPEVLTFDGKEMISLQIRTWKDLGESTELIGADKYKLLRLLNSAEYTRGEKISPYTGWSVVIRIYYGPDGERWEDINPYNNGIDYQGYYYYSDIGEFVREYLMEKYYYTSE